MDFWEAAECSCCHATDQRGFPDRQQGGLKEDMLKWGGKQRGELNEPCRTGVGWLESVNFAKYFCYVRVGRLWIPEAHQRRKLQGAQAREPIN